MNSKLSIKVGNFVFINPRSLSCGKRRVEEFKEVDMTTRFALGLILLVVAAAVGQVIDRYVLHINIPGGFVVVTAHRLLYMAFGVVTLWALRSE